MTPTPKEILEKWRHWEKELTALLLRDGRLGTMEERYIKLIQMAQDAERERCVDIIRDAGLSEEFIGAIETQEADDGNPK